VVKLSDRINNRAQAWLDEARDKQELAMAEQELFVAEEKKAMEERKKRTSNFRKENKPFDCTHNKHMGSLAVQKFITEVMERGASCSVPIGDEQAYDVIVDPKNGLLRVQVKSTWSCVYKRNGDRCANRCRVIIAKGADCKTPYAIDDADVVAIYVHPFNHWEILHSDQITGVSFSFNSAELNPTNWGILGL
jgi:hypothetical protein